MASWRELESSRDGHQSQIEVRSVPERVEVAALAALGDLKPHRPLKTNVEFYTAVLLNELGFERSWFTSLFATGRILGWMAHYLEQVASGRLIRPQSRYIGPLP